MTLFGAFNEVLTPEILAKIALYEDEPAEKTTKAVEGLVHTVFGGLLKRTTTEIGVNQLFSQLQKSGYDGSLAANLNAVLKDATQTHTVITNGNEAISRLLPAMKSSIASMISSYAGIRNSSAISLLGLTAAVVLDVLGKQVKEKKLDADGLAASLFDQREAFINAVPEGLFPQLVEKVGIQQIVAGVATPAKRAAQSPPTRSTGTATRPVPPSTVSFEPALDEEGGNSLSKWLIGLIILAALAGLGYYAWQNTQQHSASTDADLDGALMSGDTTQSDTVARSLAVPVDTSATRPAATAAATSVTTATGVGTTPAAGADATFNAALTAYLNDATQPKGRIFELSGVTFAPASLTLTPAAQGQINTLIQQLKARPTLQVQLQGYANDAPGLGLTNKALSFKRVNVIKQQLVTAGINYLRVDAIGLGTGVRPGDLGKQPMRKINVKIISK